VHRAGSILGRAHVVARALVREPFVDRGVNAVVQADDFVATELAGVRERRDLGLPADLIRKPAASRKESREVYIVAKGFKG